LAYYISFLKTLSLKLNSHSINFFYNEVRRYFNHWIALVPISSFREIMNFHFMLKHWSFLIIRKQWFVLLYEHWHLIFIKVNFRCNRKLKLHFCFLVSDLAMHRFILDRTATEYFSNLVWFIRTHIIDFDNLIRNNPE
jgi:protein CLEC16A